MKRILTFLIVLVGLSGYGQIIEFEDEGFKQYLLASSPDNNIAKNSNDESIAIDLNNDGEIQTTEVAEVFKLFVSNSYVNNDEVIQFEYNSIIGIEGFYNLSILTIINSDIIHLSISNMMNLSYLNVSYCVDITDINLENLSSLEDLTIDHCSYLQNFQYYGLDSLFDFNFENSIIPSLDFSNLPSLFMIDIRESTVLNINIENTPSLEGFRFSDGYIDFLNFSETWLLDFVDISNVQSLQSIDLSESNRFNNLTIVNNQDLRYVNLRNGKDEFFNETHFTIEYNYDHPFIYFCVDDWEIDTFSALISEQLPTSAFASTEVNTYCSFTPGGEFYEIQGTAEYDLLNDGCDVDTPNTPFPNLKFNITNQEIYGTFYGNENGAYYIPVQEGEHTITPVFENSEYFSAFPTSFTANFPTDESPFIQDICISANGEHNDLDIQITPINQARPGFDAEYKILYKNKGTTSLSGSVNLDFEGTLMDLVAANPQQSNFSDEELFWSFENLMPFESREILVSFTLNTPTDAENPLNDGDLLNFTATVNPIDGDETPQDNVFALNQTVVNSYDPNDKTCLQGDAVAPEMIGEYVHYMIRFENTGSAEAINIVVKDVINTEMFDIATLQPLDASHDFVTRIKNGNEVEFIFEDINLPFDDANNDGYVTFKIKTLDTLEVGDTFENNAEIYFDFNFPIITNTAVTNIETLSIQDINANEIEVQVYPNPVSSVLNIKSKEAIKSVQIFDVNGKLVAQTSFIGNQNLAELNVEKLPKAVYLVQITTEKGIVNEKIVKK